MEVYITPWTYDPYGIYRSQQSFSGSTRQSLPEKSAGQTVQGVTPWDSWQQWALPGQSSGTSVYENLFSNLMPQLPQSTAASGNVTDRWQQLLSGLNGNSSQSASPQIPVYQAVMPPIFQSPPGFQSLSTTSLLSPPPTFGSQPGLNSLDGWQNWNRAGVNLAMQQNGVQPLQNSLTNVNGLQPPPGSGIGILSNNPFSFGGSPFSLSGLMGGASNSFAGSLPGSSMANWAGITSRFNSFF